MERRVRCSMGASVRPLLFCRVAVRVVSFVIRFRALVESAERRSEIWQRIPNAFQQRNKLAVFIYRMVVSTSIFVR